MHFSRNFVIYICFGFHKIEVLSPTSSILFHFRRNEDNTHYFPTIKYNNEKVDFLGKKAYIICKKPAFLVCENQLYSFSKYVDGNKLVPFLKKKFVVKNMATLAICTTKHEVILDK